MTTAPSDMPPVQFADLGEVTLAYHEVCRGQGTPIIFCHGWPELAYSWRHQLAACEAAGIWAIAPDQRGYGRSSRPEAVPDYDMEHLTGDLVALMDHLKIEKAIFCGHDWGGFVVWQMPLRHPTRTAGVIGLNTPYNPRGPMDPIAMFRMAMGERMYIVWFQTPGEADAYFAANTEKALRFLMRRPSEALAPPPVEGESRFDFRTYIDGWDGKTGSELVMTEAELSVFVETFKETGFTGGINWYRNFTRNWERSADLPTRIDNLPCLMITAERDPILTPAMAANMGDHISDLETHMVMGSGHWTQQERPDDVNRLITDWMSRRFPR